MLEILSRHVSFSHPRETNNMLYLLGYTVQVKGKYFMLSVELP